jgi:hypothetical protein
MNAAVLYGGTRRRERLKRSIGFANVTPNAAERALREPHLVMRLFVAQPS